MAECICQLLFLNAKNRNAHQKSVCFYVPWCEFASHNIDFGVKPALV
jgi:hypothetical protein